MQLLLAIQIGQEWCRIDFIRGDGFSGSSAMPVREELYTDFCEKVAQKVRGLLSTPDGLRPVTAIGVAVDGAVHDNTVLESSALPFLVGKPLVSDLGHKLSLGDIPIGVISNKTAALLGSRSDLHDAMRSVESAGALEFARTLVSNR